MVAKIQNVGGKLMLELDPAMLRQSGIDPDSAVNIGVETGRLIVSSTSKGDVTDAELDASVEEMDHRYGRMMKRLAE